MKTFPLVNGPVDGLMFKTEAPPMVLRCTQAFPNCTITDFYEFDESLQKYFWSNNHLPMAVAISVSPVRPEFPCR
jgi:hypothetical protein